MNLPLVLDLAIGLTFIYLILSLLASELQELLSTILQWRAKHLKDAIETLVAGGSPNSEVELQAKELVNRIYHDPLLENINQEAKGLVSRAFRRITWAISGLYQIITKREGIFGQRSSGPSYIAPDTFATTFIETLGISSLVDRLVQRRLEAFSQKILQGIQRLANQAQPPIDLTQERAFQILVDDLADVVQSFKQNEARLLTCIDRMADALEMYGKSYLEHPDANLVSFIERVHVLKLALFGPKNERAIVSGGLQPSLAEIVDATDTGSRIHAEIRATFAEPDGATYQELQTLLNNIPAPLKHSFRILARRAQTRAQESTHELQQLRDELALWFDRSMTRASGVYKRNAKGVAIILGFLLAIGSNSDTFHIFSRLSSDPALRQVVTARAIESTPRTSMKELTVEELAALKETTNQVLQDLAMPISWSPNNVAQQLSCQSHPAPLPASTSAQSEWASFIQACLPGQPISGQEFVPFKILEAMLHHPGPTLKLLLGWLISGIAISMGSPFWFDLMSKVINVRNTGSKPASIEPDDRTSRST